MEGSGAKCVRKALPEFVRVYVRSVGGGGVGEQQRLRGASNNTWLGFSICCFMAVRPARFKRQGAGLLLPDDRAGPEEVKASQTQWGVTSEPGGRQRYTKRPPLGVSHDPVILRRGGPDLPLSRAWSS